MVLRNFLESLLHYGRYSCMIQTFVLDVVRNGQDKYNQRVLLLAYLEGRCNESLVLQLGKLMLLSNHFS